MTESQNEINTGNGSAVDGNKLNVDVLKDLCTNNADFFAQDSSENGQRLYISFLAIIDVADSIWPKIQRIEEKCAAFDFDENTPGNGYRSFVSIVNRAIESAVQLNSNVILKRSKVLFRKSSVARDVESVSHLITSLDTCLKHLETLLSWSSNGNLFPDEVHSPVELLSHCEDINQYCFYGRSMGFQYCESLRNVLQFIALSMAIFSEAYYGQGSLLSKATSHVMTTTKYLTDPEQRARRIVNISQNADVDFCKAFWFLSESELMNHVPNVVSNSIAVSQIIQLPPEPLTLTVNGREVEVPVPSAHIGNKPVQVRLISYKVRKGMIGQAASTKAEPPSRGLLIHCHGGGFVAQSSKSHESYLRDWAKQLNVPILSIDYSLAPEAPFPRALEEVTYAYCWALKNHELLGSTGEKIVAAGDSAGANLILSMTLKCIHLNIPLPMGIFVAYVPTVVNFIPSPARLLCMMDPLLPFGFMMRCLKAYACPETSKVKADNNSDTESFEEITESDLLELQAHKSPTSETSDTMTYGSLPAEDDVKEINTEEGQKYMTEFLDKYVLDSDTETDGTKVPTLKHESTCSSTSIDRSLQNKVATLVSNLRGRFSKLLLERKPTGAERFLDVDRQSSMMDEFRFVVPKDPYLSPYFADDDDLKQFPPTRVLTVHLDPCLDDCVMWAKKLKYLGTDVKLDLLNGLPHGFLNFSLLSKEAYEGSKVCIERIRSLLDLDNLPQENGK
ncbi:unnamed protein product [Brassicogethes aeneus]|uniref:Hormone-sensitive lipase n=1 Tax=Brassicogethes aeneus TaxID=1431903 RepID=A0A9P0BDW4_BRAAE|nr:unnamed protein product [Brassicogethes aeneus]